MNVFSFSSAVSVCSGQSPYARLTTDAKEVVKEGTTVSLILEIEEGWISQPGHYYQVLHRYLIFTSKNHDIAT